MNFKDKLMIYIYNKNNVLELESEALHNQVRFQPIAAWKEFLDDLYAILINCK